MQSYSSDISSVAPSLGGVIDGSFIANVKKNLLSFLPILAHQYFGLAQHILAR